MLGSPSGCRSTSPTARQHRHISRMSERCGLLTAWQCLPWRYIMTIILRADAFRASACCKPRLYAQWRTSWHQSASEDQLSESATVGAALMWLRWSSLDVYIHVDVAVLHCGKVRCLRCGLPAVSTGVCISGDRTAVRAWELAPRRRGTSRAEMDTLCHAGYSSHATSGRS